MTDRYFDLGGYSRPIHTVSATAQLWFNRGLNWAFGFHHAEARRCFQKVIDLDPGCAMGHWGLAYASGPYYNLPWPDMTADQRIEVLRNCHVLSQTALCLARDTDPAEQALCAALTQRFQEPEQEDLDVLSQWDSDYADALRAVFRQYPQDPDAAALTAEAMMCRHPWQLWDLEKRTPAEGTDTAEAVELLEKVIGEREAQGEPPHPGQLHFYIHLMEMSPQPERALPACYSLEVLLPDAGHLIHMPSHIYVLCGLYERTIEANQKAEAADQRYLAYDDAIGVYTIYRLHNIHFQIYGALFLGQYAPAYQAALRLEAVATSQAMQNQDDYIINYLEAYFGMKAHVWIRFGKWAEILAEPMPSDPALFCVTTATWHYAKGIAHAVLGQIAQAEDELVLFRAAHARVPESRPIFNNESQAILKVADSMLAGELEYRRGNYELAFDHLAQSVALYDQLNYTEPWAWMQPPRHALGALLLEQGQVARAAAIYRADLGLDDTLVRPSQHPGNIWSLHGYAECCHGLGDNEQAHLIEKQLAEVQASADVAISASCFCRVEPS
jgi:tetratricopeptide (TPR) repeat protein